MQEERMSSSGRLIRLLTGVFTGAAVALILGYGLSMGFYALGVGLIAPSGDDAAGSNFWAQSAMNYVVMHHTGIAGGSVSAGQGIFVSILWPVTIWAIIPALAMWTGGRLSAKISGLSGISRFWAGALIAVPYVLLLLVVRWFAAVPSASISLPELAGVTPAPEAVQVLLRPALFDTFLSGLIFGLLFGGLGAICGVRTLWRGLFRPGGTFPGWVRGAFIAYLAGLCVMLVLTLGLASGRSGREALVDGSGGSTVIRSLMSAAPAVAGNLHYLAHGVRLQGRIQTTVPSNFPAIEPQITSAGLFTGISYNGKSRSLPAWAYLALLIPAVSLIWGAAVAYSGAVGLSRKLTFAAKFAGAYALFLSALTPLFVMAARTVAGTGEYLTVTTVRIGPSAAQSFIFGLLLAFVFGLLGAGIHRTNADS